MWYHLLQMATFFSDTFGIESEVLEKYGAFDISVINDLPLFIDPFLLFHSEKEQYQALHQQIINYLVYLRDRTAAGTVSDGVLRNWYCFPEVKQNWLGFSTVGNGGSGLGIDFARELHKNLSVIFPDFGSESVRRVHAGLHSFLSMSLIEARWMKERALRFRHSQSLASLRQRLSQAMVRSTIQRLGSTMKPLA